MSAYIKQSNLAMGTILDYMPNTAGTVFINMLALRLWTVWRMGFNQSNPHCLIAVWLWVLKQLMFTKCLVWRMCNHEFINSPTAANASDNTTLKLTAEITPVDKQNCYRASIRALTKLNIGKQKRGRAPSRYPERKLFSVLSKRKIRNNVKCMLTKSVPQSSNSMPLLPITNIFQSINIKEVTVFSVLICVMSRNVCILIIISMTICLVML